MAKKRNLCGEIYAALLAHCLAAELPAPWDGLTTHASCFHCPDDHEAALTELRQQFERRDLFRSKIVVRTKDGGMRLIRPLRQSTNFIVALQKKDGAAPFDLVTEDGCISQAQWPVIACLEDQATGEALLECNQRLLVCFSMLELVVCRSIGLPACLSVGLDDESLDLLDELAPFCDWDTRERDMYLGKITDEQLEAEAAEYQALETRLAESMAMADAASLSDSTDENLDEDSRAGSRASVPTEAANFEGAAAAEDPAIHLGTQEPEQDTVNALTENNGPFVELAILGWQVSTMSIEEPVELASLISHLRDAEQYLGIDVGDSVSVWQPKASSMRLIEKRLEYGVTSGAASAVLESYVEEGWDLHRYGDVTRRQPTNFAEAVAHLRKVFRQEAGGGGPHEERVAKAMAWFEQFLDSDVVTPMLQEAVATNDPIRKSNLLLAAELGRMLHRETAIVDHRLQLAATLALERNQAPEEVTNAKSLLAFVDRLMKVFRELAR